MEAHPAGPPRTSQRRGRGRRHLGASGSAEAPDRRALRRLAAGRPCRRGSRAEPRIVEEGEDGHQQRHGEHAQRARAARAAAARSSRLRRRGWSPASHRRPTRPGRPHEIGRRHVGVEADLAGVRPHERAREDPAGKLARVVALEGLQHPRRDLRRLRRGPAATTPRCSRACRRNVPKSTVTVLSHGHRQSVLWSRFP